MATEIYIPTAEDLAIEKECDRKIEEIRKTNGKIKLQNKNGDPLPGKKVNIRLKKHAFHFGGWPGSRRPLPDSNIPDREVRNLYTDLFCSLFNFATIMMYWDEKPGFPTWEKEQGRTCPEFADEILSWAIPNNITVKGHTLVWTKRSALPQWVRNSSNRVKMVYLENHVRTMVGGWRGKIDRWDVVNECIWEPTLAHLGSRYWAQGETVEDIMEYAGPAFRWAREENPSAELLINDYGLEYDLNPDDPKMPKVEHQREHYRNVIQALGDQGTPPDAIGLQTHDTNIWYAPEVLHKTWDYFAATGLPLHITEVVAGYRKGEIKGGWKAGEWDDSKYLYAFRQMFKLAFAHPSIHSLITYSTLHSGHYWNGKKNALYDTLYDLIVGEWSYNEDLVTDENGEIDFRGFYGDYDITVKGDIRDERFDLTLSDKMSFRNDVIFTV